MAGSFLAGSAVLTHAARAVTPADLAYRNGYVYTVDAKNSVQQALAVLNGRIVYVGDDAGIGDYIGKHTHVVDLHGRMLMPGLVDGHMHPMMGGASLLKCNLQYERLTIEQMQARIQACLDQTRNREPDAWLEVVNWFQEAMLPAGTVPTHAVLDALKTSRPIFVRSSFGHSGLVNGRAIQLAGIVKGTQDPPHGHIVRDSAGVPTGVLDDAAQRLVDHLIPPASLEDNVRAVKAALDAARKQGITSFLDAKATEATLAAFATVEHQGGLTARAHFAVLVEPAEGADPQKVVSRLMKLRQRYDEGPVAVRPAMSVRNMKLFLDGVISAPALTGAMLEPYWLPSDASANAVWGRVRTVVLQFISPRRYSRRCSSQCHGQGSKRICMRTEIAQSAKASTRWRRCAAHCRVATFALALPTTRLWTRRIFRASSNSTSFPSCHFSGRSGRPIPWIT